MPKKALYALILTLVAVLLLYMIPTTVTYEKEPQSTQNEATEDIASLIPELVPICSCESMQGKYGTPTHYEEDGVTVMRGRVNPDDIGICQINLGYHQETADAMGLDLFVEANNITFANWLYEQSGNSAWSWSRSCWE